MQGSFLDGNGTVRCGSPYSISTLTELDCEGRDGCRGVASTYVLKVQVHLDMEHVLDITGHLTDIRLIKMPCQGLDKKTLFMANRPI